MKKISKVLLTGALSLGIGLGGIALAGCEFTAPELDLRVNGQYVQWTSDGENWENLISIEDLKGKDGLNGKDGNGIKSIEIDQTKSDETKTTYVITFDNGTTFTFEVKNGTNIVEQPQPSQEKIEVYEGFKSEYIIGDEVDVAGGILTYTDETGKESYVEIKADMVSAFSTATAGERKMIITYEGLTVLYEYSVEEPAFVEYGVPYYVSQDAGSEEGLQHSSFIFNEDGTISMWATSILPTLNNKDEIFKTSVAGATYLGKVSEYEKDVVNKKYVLSFAADIGGATPIATTVTIEDENTIKVEQIIQEGQPAYTVTMKAAGNEDEKLEYDNYYVGSFTFTSTNGEEVTEGTQYIIIDFNKDGTMSYYASTILPTEKNIEELVATLDEPFEGVYNNKYTSSIVDGKLTLKKDEIGEMTLNADGTITIATAGDATMKILCSTQLSTADEKLEYDTYYASEIMEEGSATPYAILKLTKDGKCNMYPVGIMPTAKNIEALIAEAESTGNVVEWKYTSKLADGKLVMELENGGSLIINENGLLTLAVSGDYTLNVNFSKELSTADEKLEYGAYYYSVDPNNLEQTAEGETWYIFYQFTADGKVKLAGDAFKEIPTFDDIQEILETGISEYDYKSYVQEDEFIIDMDYFVFHIDNEGAIQNIATGVGEDGESYTLTIDLMKMV